jgi:hypothetical protein
MANRLSTRNKTQLEEVEIALNKEQEHFYQRLNMFLLSESMLILAYVTSLNATNSEKVIWLLTIIGMILTGVFVFIFDRSLDYMATLIEQGKKVYSKFKYPSYPTNTLLGRVVTIIFFAVWIYFLVLYWL